ncbi:major facilitator superfamily MFS_1 [Xylanimonas cellulosilytica DSM 15894]|uniref:Major facilitator superfamily MFS_1 n=1 Tax=Xylanimonas cellulosilytica (strain DSM 15894 / JCM 12276 / CECT 5975 / KCTC 9989 / LMG 20990 / NBRC 107835 / XIL07) TaxID=446471 RepID=D1BZJ2_XYLCX|nr:MFS transporter [Xylanimonas cellulosilytica]ACZ30146.1 major facilitator superfamily MFS_1 [Xylanimonas cellulosilytica DSM 15894]
MATLLLALIYLAFVSLGLPDSLLGAGWPAMQQDLGVPLSYAGLVAMVISGGTIVSSLLSDRMTRRFGAGRVTAASVLVSALALLGFSLVGSFWPLLVLAVPFGLSAGAIDAALNNHVALHYSSRHMNWLHCFWGVGTVISPFFMAQALASQHGWAGGYRTVALIQLGIGVVLVATLPLWRRQLAQTAELRTTARALRLPEILRIRGVKSLLLAFFGYCAVEGTAILWGASYLAIQRGVDTTTAARYAALFLLGITGGRFLAGFVADRLGDRTMIRLGLALMAVGIVAVWLPVPGTASALNGLVVLGLGCAPIYPAIIHSTPANFGAENSQAIVGVQMAAAYTGSVAAPPLFGLIANHVDIGLFPLYLLVLTVLVAVMIERVARRTAAAPVGAV